MKKLLNRPEDFVDETLAGIVKAHSELRLVPDWPRAIVRSDAPLAGKVSIVTGGGSGNLPVFLGYVGRGLCSAAAVGNVFSLPSVETVVAASRAVDGGAGGLFLYGNYGGDVLTFDEAAEELADAGIEIRTVVAADDVASAPPNEAHRRRGVAGIVFAYKIAGAAAEAGRGLAEVVELTQRTVRNTKTMGVGLAPCILPTTGVPTFELEADEMEIGVGIHGERGVSREPLKSARAVGRELTQRVIAEVPTGSRVAVMVNSLGATSLEELYIVYGAIRQQLDTDGVAVTRTYVGRYATSLEMAGMSLTVLVLDDELESLLNAPAASPFFVEPGDESGRH